MFRSAPLSIIRSFILYTQQYVIQVLLRACELDQDGILMMNRGPVRNM
jgi:hypothetical protein